MSSTLLSGPTVSLRALGVGDLERLRAWRRDPDFACPSASLAWPPTDDRLEAMLRPTDALRAFVLEPLDSGEPIGWCALLGLDWKNRHVGLAWGQAADANPALEAEALAVLLAFAFRELNLERVEAEVYADEATATLQGLGLALEAVKREAARRPGSPAGRFADVALWGMLRNERENR